MSQLTFLANVSLNEEIVETNNENNDTTAKEKKTRGPNKDYKFDKTYSDKTEAEKVIENEKIWSFFRKRDSKDGKKLFYRCIKVKYRKTQCAAGLHILLHAADTNCSIYRTYCKFKYIFF